MIWQDILLAAGGWVLAAALIPTLIGREKPALSSSLLTGSVLASFAFAYYTLELWNAALSTAALTAIWLLLAVQAWRARSRQAMLESEHGRPSDAQRDIPSRTGEQ
jgi:hypothetical protein